MSAVPRELNFDIPPILFGIDSEEMRMPTLTTLDGLTGGSVVDINIPQIPNSFMDPQTLCLSLSVEVAVGVQDAYRTRSILVGGVAANKFDVEANGFTNSDDWEQFCIVGKAGGMSFIRRLTSYFNNSVLLDDIDNVNSLTHWWKVLTENASDAAGSQLLTSSDPNGSTSMGIKIGGSVPFAGEVHDAAAAGVAYAANTITQVMNFNIPLPGILGMGSAGKMIPLFLGPHRLSFMLEQLSNILWYGSETSGAGVVGGANRSHLNKYRVLRAELVCQRITLESGLFQKVIASTGGELKIRANTFSTTTSFIPANTSGTIDLPLSVRASSAKLMATAFSPSNAHGKVFSGVQPDAAFMSYFINGRNIPTNMSNFIISPNDQFYRTLQTFGVYSTTNGKGNIVPKAFMSSLTKHSPAAQFDVYAIDGTGNPFNTVPDNFIYCQDIESFGSKGSGGGFLSGQNLATGTVYLKMSFQNPVLNNISLNARTFVMHDAVVTYLLGAHTVTIQK